jgi:hypothetical protein
LKCGEGLQHAFAGRRHCPVEGDKPGVHRRIQLIDREDIGKVPLIILDHHGKFVQIEPLIM